MQNDVNELAEMYLEQAGEQMEAEGYPDYIMFENSDGKVIKYELVEE